MLNTSKKVKRTRHQRQIQKEITMAVNPFPESRIIEFTAFHSESVKEVFVKVGHYAI
jgi:hypothetical protein